MTIAEAGAAVETGMHVELSEGQQQARLEFRAFTREHVTPFAADWDRERAIPMDLVQKMRERGYLGAILPTDCGGGGMDPVTYGLLTEELSVGCSSVRTLLTVHDMAAVAINRWGNAKLRETFMPRIATGELIAAMALSEENVGSDAAAVEAEAHEVEDGWVLNGSKHWTTYGMMADVILVFAAVIQDGDRKLAAFLVPADTPGLERQPIPGMTGLRASRIAHLDLRDCKVPKDHLVGRVGFGFSHVGSTALDQGRYSVAWGSVGLAQACLDATLDYTASRHQFGVPLNKHQLVRRKLTEMIVNTRAARLLCYRAGFQRRVGDPSAAVEAMVAKYYASRVASSAAADAVQLHGARGLNEASPVERYQRDALVGEIIEGSSQIQQIIIPRSPLPEL